MSDRYVSRASLTVALPNKEKFQQVQKCSSPARSRRPPATSSSSLYHNAAQPIHPVLHRRSTPLRVHHPVRRATQTVSLPFNNEDDDGDKLSKDRTGRQPIPPPRGPRFKIGLVRNVSQNGLRSPQLSPRPRRGLGRQDEYVPECDQQPVKATLVRRSNFPSSEMAPRQKDGYDNSKSSRFYIDLPSMRVNESDKSTSSPPRRFNFHRIGVPHQEPSHHRHQNESEQRKQERGAFVRVREDAFTKVMSPSFDEIVDEIFKTIASEDLQDELETDQFTVTQNTNVRNEVSAHVQRSKSDATLKKQPLLRRSINSLVPISTVPNDLLIHTRDKPDSQPKMEFVEENTYVRYHPNHGNPNNNIVQRVRNTLANFRARLNTTKALSHPMRKSSCPCPNENDLVEECVSDSQTNVFAFEDGLVKPVDHTQNLDRTRKVTSADSGIVDWTHEDDRSNSSRHHRKCVPPQVANGSCSTDSNGSSESRMRRSHSQPPNRMLSFSSSSHDQHQQKEEKTSDLDRSVSARSSRTSDLSESSDCATTPFYVESLWSQVRYEVDPENLHQQRESCCENMRANVVMEIVKNERDFVRNLKDVIEGYLYKCRQRPDMFSKGRIECIFGNVESLYEFQCEFLADLEASINSGNIQASEIGHCFLLHQRGFSELYSDYCNNHSLSAVELQQLKQLKQYAHFFEACRMLQDMVEISLDGFLLQPVQKICKYPLQLSELSKCTAKDHPDGQSVQLALEAMKSVTGMINERKRRLECLEKIALWQETIDVWDGEDLVERSSQLIHYGDLNKLSSKNSWTHEYTFFLFDHQLIYCRRDMLKRNILSYKARFDMNQVEIVDLEQNDAGIKHGWVIVCPQKEQSTILLAKNPEEKSRWMQAFKDERKRVQDDLAQGFCIAAKDRLSAIQSAKILALGKERKRSTTKEALKDLTDHTQLVQSMRSKSMSMTLPVRIRVGQNHRNNRLPIPNKNA